MFMYTLKSKPENAGIAPLPLVKEQYSNYIARKISALVAGTVLLFVLIIVSVSSGSAGLSFIDVVRAILSCVRQAATT